MIAVGGELLVGLAVVLGAVCWGYLKAAEWLDREEERMSDDWITRQRRER